MEKEKIIKEINPLPSQEVFFTAISYGTIYHLTDGRTFSISDETEILLVTGIADPVPEEIACRESNSYHMLQYPDHHIFTIDDMQEILKRFSEIDARDKIILTTEKDAVRLEKFRNEISGIPWYVIRSGIIFYSAKERSLTTGSSVSLIISSKEHKR